MIILRFIDKIPMSLIVVTSVLLTPAPWFPAVIYGIDPVPQAHLLEKLGMLFDGTLSRPIDIFDLFLHGTPISLLMIRLLRMEPEKDGEEG